MTDLIKEMGVEGKLQQNPDTYKPFVKETTAAAITVQVDTTQQLLRPIRPAATFTMPVTTENGRYVLEGLWKCFKKAGFVKEGLIKDLLWGFVDVCGYTPEKVAYGLVDLHRAGYVKFIAPDNAEVDEHATRLGECWLKYTDKLIALVN